MAEERKRLSLHDHSSSTSTRPPSSRRDVKPREEKATGDIKARHRAERAAMFQAHRSESRSLFGNHAEEQRQMASRHEKSIADLHEIQERDRAGAPRWRDPAIRSGQAPRGAGYRH
jgi:hypothetical protein